MNSYTELASKSCFTCNRNRYGELEDMLWYIVCIILSVDDSSCDVPCVALANYDNLSNNNYVCTITYICKLALFYHRW